MAAQIIPGPYDLDLGSHQTPFFFGEDNENLIFGWFHSPDPAIEKRPKNVGVVLCNPFGFEEVSAHRGLRSLALECASAGFPCIRFDYLGCGNSARDEYSENHVQQWVKSIGLAIDAVKDLGRVEKVILVGFRLGFSLAVTASVGRTDVLGMVAVSPVVKGREYLRELRLLTSSENQDDAGLLGIALAPSGFIITDSTATEIQKIDLAEIELGTKKLLIVEETQLPPRVETWAQIAGSNDVSVDTALIDGYLQLSADPQTSQVPSNLFDKIVRCIEGWSDLASDEGGHVKSAYTRSNDRLILTQCRRTDSASIANLSKGMNENIVSIPVGTQRLFGILHECPSIGSDRTLVFLNAGMVRNIGPNRMFVQLARAWTQEGYRVLRFDFSGVGDSQSRTSQGINTSYSQTVSEELEAAIRFLQQRGASEIRLVGLCSGAYHAFRGVVAGLPVHSAIMINPLAFDQQDLGGGYDKSFTTYEVLDLFTKFKNQIQTRTFWSKLRRGQLDIFTLRKLISRRLKFAIDQLFNSLYRNLGMKHKSDTVQDLRNTLSNGVSLDFLFSESDPGFELLSKRTGRALPELQQDRNFRVYRIPNADHTFTNIGARSRLLTELNKLIVLESVAGAND